MADLTVYIRKGYTGGDGSGSSYSNAYTDFTDFHGDMPDMSSYENVYVMCQRESGAGEDNVNQKNFDATHPASGEQPTGKIILMANDGVDNGSDQRAGPTWDDTKYTIVSDAAAPVTGVSGAVLCGIEFRRLQFQLDDSYSVLVGLRSSSGSEAIAVVGNIFRVGGGTSGTVYEAIDIDFDGGSNPVNIENNLCYAESGYVWRGFIRGYYSGSVGAEYVIANNTVSDCHQGFLLGEPSSNSNLFFYNNIAVESTNYDYDHANTITNAGTNLHGDAGEDTDKSYCTAITPTTETDIFDSYATDFQSSHSDVVGAGTDLSGLGSPPAAYETTDMVGVDRGSSWDIGCFQHEAIDTPIFFGGKLQHDGSRRSVII